MPSLVALVGPACNLLTSYCGAWGCGGPSPLPPPTIFPPASMKTHSLEYTTPFPSRTASLPVLHPHSYSILASSCYSLHAAPLIALGLLLLWPLIPPQILSPTVLLKIKPDFSKFMVNSSVYLRKQESVLVPGSAFRVSSASDPFCHHSPNPDHLKTGTVAAASDLVSLLLPASILSRPASRAVLLNCQSEHAFPLSQRLPAQFRGKANKSLRVPLSAPLTSPTSSPTTLSSRCCCPIGLLAVWTVWPLLPPGLCTHSHVPLLSGRFPRDPRGSSLTLQVSVRMSPSQWGLPSPLGCRSPEDMHFLKVTAFVSCSVLCPSA